MLKRRVRKIEKFFAEQEAKKAICKECLHCKQSHWMSEPVCYHPSRVSKKKNYVSGDIKETAYTCWSYNDVGQCGLFKQKEETEDEQQYLW